MHRRYLMIMVAVFTAISIQSVAQDNDIEEWRKMGYEAGINGEYASAVMYYHKVLELQHDDYDAQLAIARLHFLDGNYKTSVFYFKKILDNDSSDVEALKGMGDNNLYMDNIPAAIQYYRKAIDYLPGYVPLYLQLAKAYSWQGDLDKAIAAYRKIIDIDDTYSEAWYGIGQIYYWMEKPRSALPYYERALELDPSTEKVRKEFDEINAQLKFALSGKLKLVNESEESYQINAVIQQYRIQKRFNDHFNLSLNFLLDHSNRDFTYTETGDTIRWYDNTWIKAGWLTEHHQIYAYGGYSKSDRKFSAYGVNWIWNFALNSLKFKNDFTTGYDYFYYWNQVGMNLLADNLSLKYKKLGIDLGFGYGVIDEAPIIDVREDKYTTGNNTRKRFGFSMSYKIVSVPMITLAANYSYLDYRYKSTYYYSPYGRNLYGPSIKFYYHLNKFYFYGNFSYNFGFEHYYDVASSSSSGQSSGKTDNFKKVYINANNWSGNAEVGYALRSFVVSLNTSRFFNDYYSNYFVSLNLKFLF